MKLTSSAMATNLEFVSISGPAYGFDLPPFQWSKVTWNDCKNFLSIASLTYLNNQG